MVGMQCILGSIANQTALIAVCILRLGCWVVYLLQIILLITCEGEQIAEREGKVAASL